MRPSIRRRLTFLTSLASALLVASASIIVYWRMAVALQADLDQSLQTEAVALAGRLEDEAGQIQFEFDPATAAWPADLLIRIQDRDGNIIFQTNNFNVYDIRENQSLAAADAPIRWFKFNADHNRPYRAISVRSAVTRDAEDERPRAGHDGLVAFVCVARPLTPLLQTLQTLAWTLAGAVLAALVVASLVGRRVAHSGVRPIRDIARVIENVRPGQPQLPINDEDVPEELDPIVNKTNDLLARIEAELTRQRQLTADVAHDLRTPVAGVRTLLDVALQRPRPPAEYEEALQTARAALARLSGLLEDVLTLARLDAAVAGPQLGPVTLTEALSDAIAAVSPLAISRNVRIESICDAALIATTHRAQLAKIMTNLLDNAVEHSPAGETVTIAAIPRENQVEIRVTDRGPGIAPGLRGRIFDRFVRGDDARTGDGHHGLGLSIAHGLARLLGGDLRLAPPTTRGSEFILTLPRNQ